MGAPDDQPRRQLEVRHRGRHYRLESADGGAWRVFRKRGEALIEVHGLEKFRAAKAVFGARVRRPSPRALSPTER